MNDAQHNVGDVMQILQSTTGAQTASFRARELVDLRRALDGDGAGRGAAKGRARRAIRGRVASIVAEMERELGETGEASDDRRASGTRTAGTREERDHGR